MIEQRERRPFDPHTFLMNSGLAQTSSPYRGGELIFAQGDPADCVLYLQHGKVKLAVTARNGREGIVGICQEHAFFGESALLGQPMRLATATAMTNCTIDRIGRTDMLKALHKDVVFAETFTHHLLTRNTKAEADLVDHLLNSSEKRLARVLLLLANFGKEGNPDPITTKISQETLSEMIGTTRSRVSFFMNKFRILKFIDYDAGYITVHSSLLSVLLQE